MGNSTGDRASPTHARPHRYLAELERLPDGRLRATLYRDGHPVHREWVRSQRHGRRRVIDLICTAVDTDAPSEDETGVADQSAREWPPAGRQRIHPHIRSQGG